MSAKNVTTMISKAGEQITKTTIGAIKKGEFFKTQPDTKKVYVHEGYDRMNKKYCGQDYDDISHFIYRKKDCVVYIGFEF